MSVTLPKGTRHAPNTTSGTPSSCSLQYESADESRSLPFPDMNSAGEEPCEGLCGSGIAMITLTSTSDALFTLSSIIVVVDEDSGGSGNTGEAGAVSEDDDEAERDRRHDLICENGLRFCSKPDFG